MGVGGEVNGAGDGLRIVISGGSGLGNAVESDVRSQSFLIPPFHLAAYLTVDQFSGHQIF
jgi:hypothetical protein